MTFLVASRKALRMEQMSNLPTIMHEDLRIQAQVKLRMLRIFNFQRQLRSEVKKTYNLKFHIFFLRITFQFIKENFFFR